MWYFYELGILTSIEAIALNEGYILDNHFQYFSDEDEIIILKRALKELQEYYKQEEIKET